MGVLRFSLLCLCFPLLSCQLGYLAKSAYNQVGLLNSQVDIQAALKDPALSEDERRKLQLSQEAKIFAEQDLHLKPSKNYSGFVKLNRPYVTYVVNASDKWKLDHFQWHYPIVGKMPYKGYFNEDDAKQEEKELQERGLDTYLRGVSAYSTLGWFRDPLLSSMLRSSDHDLVNTIIHELVHATLYIKNSADFNERMAVFLGNLGAEMFYLKKEGPDSATVKRIKSENEDEKAFSEFITAEIATLEAWYKQDTKHDPSEREAKLRDIQNHFVEKLQPKLKSGMYKKFPEQKLNNARLLLYKTYLQDLSDFEKLYEKVGRDFQKFIAECQKLEKHPHPEQGLKEL